MKEYKLTLTTNTTFSEEDKFHIRDQFDTLSMILDDYNGGEIREGEYYFKYAYERDDKIFIEDENEKEYFSFTDIRGYYRPAKNGHDIIDITVLNDKGEDVVVMQFEIKKKDVTEFVDAFEDYINYYSLKSDTRFEVKSVK